MSNPVYFRMKGTIAYRPAGAATPYLNLGEIESGELAQSVETIELQSNSDEGGIVESAELSRSAELNLAIRKLDVSNLKLAHAATSADVAAGTVSVTLPIGPAGSLVDTGVCNITGTTFAGLVEGTDYTVKARAGVIQYITACAAAVTGDVEHDAFTKLGVMAAALPEIEVLYFSETTGKAYIFPRVKLSPASTVPLIQSGNEFASGQLNGKVLVKENAFSDPVLGKLGYLRG